LFSFGWSHQVFGSSSGVMFLLRYEITDFTIPDIGLLS